jgi:hypothetical protein
MAKPGLSFENPMFLPTQGTPVELANPYARANAATMPGVGGLQQGLTDIATMGAAARQSLSQTEALSTMRAPQMGDGNIFFERNKRRFFVNGVEIDEQDDRRILESEGLLGQPSVGAPGEGDWVAIPDSAYRQFIQQIKEPTRGELFTRGFAIGAQQLKQLGGSALDRTSTRLNSSH